MEVPATSTAAQDTLARYRAIGLPPGASSAPGAIAGR